MITKKEIIEALYECIEESNQVNGTEIAKTPDTVLVGSGSELDSIDFIALVVAIEGKLYDKHGINISITAEKAMSQKNSPFRTIDTLADYILELLR